MTSDLDRTPLYLQIAESIRQEIVYGALHPGDSLPSLRANAERWRCTVGTVQRAYAELAREGLVATRFGQGTRVIEAAPAAGPAAPLRRATLANQTERFLLEMLAAGYHADEVEQALRLALERWQAIADDHASAPLQTLRFAGSHDPAVSAVAARFDQIAPGWTLALRFNGSLGGLMALAQGEADIAGCHLWDQASDSYNGAFVQHLLPGRTAALLTLAHRRLGLLTPAGNPQGIAGLADLARAGRRFINRQRGSGTRVWLDAQLQAAGVDVTAIAGYEVEVATHSAVAEAVAAGQADVGLGIEAAALAHGLGFRPLASERYDLAIAALVWAQPAVQALAAWLSSDAAKDIIDALGGYDTAETGRVVWVE
ncbi:MAG TPA: substrate-binding domain-containing protein [Anaerolineae bacterium]|nr:substrate-binding domain-containing protein [Anaerolineae bacterium]